MSVDLATLGVSRNQISAVLARKTRQRDALAAVQASILARKWLAALPFLG